MSKLIKIFFDISYFLFRKTYFCFWFTKYFCYIFRFVFIAFDTSTFCDKFNSFNDRFIILILWGKKFCYNFCFYSYTMGAS